MSEPRETSAPLRLALVIDPGPLSPAAQALIDWCRAQPALKVLQIFIGRPPDTPAPGRLRRLAVNLLLQVESRLLRSFKPLARPLRQFDPAHGDLPCQSLSPASPDTTLPASLDLLVHLGNSPLPPDLLQRARLGALRTWPALAPVSASGIPCFDDVLRQREQTGFALLHQRPDGEARLVSGTLRTRFFTLLNQHFLFSKLRHYLQVQLLDIAACGEVRPTGPRAFVPPAPAAGFPGLSATLSYAAGLCRILASELVNRKLRRRFNRWNVGFARGDWRQLHLPQAHQIGNRPGHFIADPFVIRDASGDFCFVEDYDFDRQLGTIAAYRLHERKADFLGEVIVEPHHLSFPFLFRHQGKLLMCPESSAARRITLYESEAFPLRWRPVHTVMDKVCAADSLFFEHDGRWWLFTNIDPSNEEDCNAELMIFHADSPLTDHWIPHAQNPIYIDSSKARNGGLIVEGDQIYRVSQRQGFNAYGTGHAIHRIVTLTPDEYLEETVLTRSPADFPGVDGSHHCHVDGDLCVFDFRRAEAVDR